MSVSDRKYTEEEVIDLMADAYVAAYEDKANRFKIPDSEGIKTIVAEILEDKTEGKL